MKKKILSKKILRSLVQESIRELVREQEMPNTMMGYACSCTGYATGTTFFSDGSTGPNMLAWNLVDSSYGAGAGSSFPGTEEINGQIPVGTWTPNVGYAGTIWADMPSDSGNPYVWFTQQLYDDNGNCIPNPINCQVEEDSCSQLQSANPDLYDYCYAHCQMQGAGPMPPQCPNNFEDECCSDDHVVDDPCKDPNWLNMPMGTSTSGEKINYCERCTATSSDGNPVNGNFPAILDSSAPYWVGDPSGTNYCPCCEPEGCSEMIMIGDPLYGECSKCFSVAGGSGSGYNDAITGLHTDTPPCPCCEPEIINPDPKVKCECCKNGNPISMAQWVAPGQCSSLNNPASGIYNCTTSPVSGGPGTKSCKKKTRTPITPVSAVKPNNDPTRGLREASNYIKKIIK